MIFLFTDFGAADIYVGQVKARLAGHAPAIIDLLHAAPAFDIVASAHLLAALAARIPPGSVVLAVVDPGVGTARKPVVLRAAGSCFVGPDNGLLSVLPAGSADAAVWEIVWRPEDLSSSFHGRDLFAPIAARLASGEFPHDALRAVAGLDVVLDAGPLARVIYIDHYGNAMTGLPARGIAEDSVVRVGGTRIAHARVFGAVAPGTAFWYANSLDRLEIACNRDSASACLGLRIGDPIALEAG